MLVMGFGIKSVQTDMILWQAIGTQSKVSDLWSSSAWIAPVVDNLNNLNSTFVQNNNSTVTFTTTRSMNTGDLEKDYLVQYMQDCYFSVQSS